MGREGVEREALRCKGVPTSEMILSGVDVVHVGGEEKGDGAPGECEIA